MRYFWRRLLHHLASCSFFLEKSYYKEGDDELQVVACTQCGRIHQSRCPKSGTWDPGPPCIGCYVEDQNTYSVKGDHPILRRPDKSNLSYLGAICYAHELKYIGYENVNITPTGEGCAV